MAGSISEMSPRASWDFGTVGAHFNQVTQVRETKQGTGGTIVIPPTGEPKAAVTIFPDTNQVRIRTRDSDHYIRNALPPLLSPAGMLIETTDGSTQAFVTRTGAVAMQSFPTPQMPLESPTGIPDTQDAEILGSTPSAIPGASEAEIRPSGDVPATPESAGRQRQLPTAYEALQLKAPDGMHPKEYQPRVRWEGYVTYKPNFSANGKGETRANFMVSEKIETVEGEKTVYHKVYTTKREADRLLKEGIDTGWKVKVEGYLQMRTGADKDGNPIPDPRFYANHVSILRRKDEPATDSDSGANAAESRRGNAG